ncbi:MAG TPA: aspartyl protease family protein [Caulobacteraceae bacterium]|jgi:predicted aspartyl protease|nr:aspartyl protease family protein [Caulobacteraceae bacterium]
MAHHGWDRRRITAGLAAGLGAGLASPLAARANPVFATSADSPLAARDYAPPTDLLTLADVYQRMTAPVRVNGQGPYPFVVDTGANRSVISIELAARLGLAAGPREMLHGVAGEEMVAVTSATLNLGGRDQADTVLSMLPQISIGGPGMLGVDRLHDQSLTLDFQDQRLEIETSRYARRDPGAVTVHARRRSGQLTVVDAELAGARMTALLDSGAQSTIGNMALFEIAVTNAPGVSWTDVAIISATGQTMGAQTATLPRLRIGGLQFPAWTIAFADLHTFKLWNLIDRPALLLGVDALSRFESVSLDFARDEVRFRLPKPVSART